MNRSRSRSRRASALALCVVSVMAAGACRSSSSTSSPSSGAARTSTTTAPSTTTTVPPSTTVLPPHLGSSSPLPSVPQPGEPVAAETASGMAEQLTEAWATLSDATAGEERWARAAHVEQVVVRALSSTKSNLRAATLSALASGELRAHQAANVDASAKLRSLVGKPRTALPPWRIVDPAPAAELRGYYDEAQADYGVPWQYLAAVNFVETRFGRIRGTSEAGAQGPMQFLPATWKQYGEGGDINSYRDSIRAAARYLKRNGAPGDMRNALFNYNRSNLYVDAVLAYGDRMAADEAAFRSYYRWQVYYLTTAGDVWLPTGYGP